MDKPTKEEIVNKHDEQVKQVNLEYVDRKTSERNLLKRQCSALIRSVAHWRRQYEAIEVADVNKEGWGGDSCACCEEFKDGSSAIEHGTKDCDECPIRLYTGRENCKDTPYDNAAWLMDDYTGILLPTEVKEVLERDEVFKSMKIAVNKELEFLLEVSEAWEEKLKNFSGLIQLEKTMHISVDTPVYVTDSADTAKTPERCLKRHFAGRKAGLVEAWPRGKTSFTLDKDNKAVSWIYAFVDPKYVENLPNVATHELYGKFF
jgi:hypothetical protein